MTPDTPVCRAEWALLLQNIIDARAAARALSKEMEERPEATEAEKKAAAGQCVKMMYLEFWAEKELATVNAYCDWVNISLKFSDADYLAAIYDVAAFNRLRRVAHWKSLVT
jgi:hypothetical protein